MYTVTLAGCYLVALWLLIVMFHSYWKDLPRAQCVECGKMHRQRNTRRDGGGFKAFCNTVCQETCMTRPITSASRWY